MNALAKNLKIKVSVRREWTASILLFLSLSLYAQPPAASSCGRNIFVFDGVDDHISTASNDVDGAAGTLEAWVRKDDWTDFASDPAIFGNGINFTVVGSFYVSLHPIVGIHFRYGDASVNPSALAAGKALSDGFTPGSWHHVAVTWQHVNTTETETKLIVDGIEVASTTGNYRLSGNQPDFFIGQNESSQLFFGGSIADVRQWSIVRTAAEIAADMSTRLMGTESGLNDYWPLDDNEGTTNPENLVSIGNLATVEDVNANSPFVPDFTIPIVSVGHDEICSGGAYDFDLAIVGLTKTKTFILTNYSTSSISVTSIPQVSLSGLDAAEFSLDLSGMTTTLNAGQSTTFIIQFSPAGFGERQAMATLEIDNVDYSFMINGEGSVAEPPIAGTCGRNYLEFDGIEDYLSLDNSTINGTEGTWEAWVRKEDWQYYDQGVLFGNGISHQLDNSIYLSFHSLVGLHFRYGGNAQPGNTAIFPGDFTATASFAPGSWHHIAATWKESSGSTDLKIYLDGTELVSGTAGLQAQAHNDLYFGGFSFENAELDQLEAGAMAEIRTWNVARTEVEIVNGMTVRLSGTESSLTGYWPIDDVAGSTAAYNMVIDGSVANLNNFDPSDWQVGEAGLQLSVGNSTQPNGGELSFGVTSLSNSEQQDFIIVNNSANVVTFSNNPVITLSGPDQPDFTIDENSMPASLVVGAQGQFTITFDPSDAGTKSARVTIGSDEACGNSSFSIDLTGVGVDSPPLSFESPAVVSLREGQSEVLDIEVNDGTGAMADVGITYSITGSDAQFFSIDQNTGILLFKDLPDFEQPLDNDGNNIYNITVLATSEATGIRQNQFLTVNVLDLAELNFLVEQSPETVGGVTATYFNGSFQHGGYQSPVPAYLFDMGINISYINFTTGNFDPNILFTLEDGSNIPGSLPKFAHQQEFYFGHERVVRIDVNSLGDHVLLYNIEFTIPPILAATNNLQYENGGTADVVDLEAVDGGGNPDDGIEYQFSVIQEDDRALFSVNQATGVISFLSPPDINNPLDSNADNVYELTVKASSLSGVATQQITIAVLGPNTPPVLDPILGQSVDEHVAVNFTASGTDAEMNPVQTLTFSLDQTSVDKGMTIDGSTGAFSWTPADEYHGDHSVMVTITDNGLGYLTDDETITITVNETNSAPVITAIGNQSVDELVELAFTAVTTDVDIPTNTLSYSLDATSLAQGMSLNGVSGAFSWTPTETQSGNHSVTVAVIDDGIGNLTDDETFTITVNEANAAPILSAIGNQSIDEESELIFATSATDSDLPANSLTFSLDATSLGKGMTIDGTTGDFSWTPSEPQSGDHTVTIIVTDDGAGNLTDDETITITVNEINESPTLATIGNQGVDEHTMLSFTASAIDDDLPAQILSFSLDAISLTKGMVVNGTTGDFTWTPSETQQGDHTVTITVIDDGPGSLSDEKTITITVNETNSAPVMSAIGNQSVNEEVALTFTATATDSDLPTNNITFSLDATSLGKGMTLDGTTGAFAWTPTEVQNGDHTVTITVTDNGIGILTDEETITIAVNEVNTAPSLTTIGNQSVDELIELMFLASATDEDLPAQNLSFSLDAISVGKGMAISGLNGAFSWTPGENQDGDHIVTITVTDDGVGTLSDEEIITITVNETNNAPVLTMIGNRSVDKETTINFTAMATDSDIPTNNLSYSIDAISLGKGMTINSSTGDFAWMPDNLQVGDHNVVITVEDDGIGNLTDDEVITIAVNDTNFPPVLTAIGDRSVNEEEQLSFTVEATDATNQTLMYELDANSENKGMSLNSSTGEFNWMPTETQHGDHAVVISVTDDGIGTLSDSEVITISVNEVNSTPVLTSIGDQSVDEQNQLNFTVFATDSDLPVNTLIYDLDAASLAKGMIIDGTTGTFSWTPTEAQSGSHDVTLKVTDNGTGSLTDEETITITVAEINEAPVLDPVDDQTAEAGVLMTFMVSATDVDVPGNMLTFSLGAASLAKGMQINATSGVFSWTPATTDAGSANSVTVTVSDGPLSDNLSFEISVEKLNQTIDFQAIADIDLELGNTVTLTATSTSGLNVTFELTEGDGTIVGSELTVNSTGNFTIEARQLGNANYNPATVAIQSFTVFDSRKTDQTITFPQIADRIYGDVFDLNAAASSGLAISYVLLSGPAMISSSEITISGVGLITIEAGQSGDGTFNPASAVTRSFAAGKAPLTATADDQARVFNTANPTLTLSYDGFIGGDVEADLDVLPAASTAADIGSDTGSYAIDVSGGTDDLYDINPVSGVMTILRAMATVSLSDLEQEADGSEKFPTVNTDPANLNYIIDWAAGGAPMDQGDYDFTVTTDEVNYEGSATGTMVLSGVLRINDLTLKMYPNPSSAYLIVESDESSEITIFDLNGKKVLTGTSSEELDISTLDDGMFIVELKRPGGKISHLKMVKKAN